MKKFISAWGVALIVALTGLALAACSDGERAVFTTFDIPEIDSEIQVLEVGWTGIDMNIEANLTIAMWCAASGFLEDIGRVYHDLSETESIRIAKTTAAARVFNTFFPNVQINVYMPSGPGAAGSPAQRSGFVLERGYHPHIFATNNITNEILLGNAADLSIFADDPVFDFMNPTIKQLMMHHDRVFALPLFAHPYGIFVNRTLAENQNLDVPPINWTLRDYESFVSNSRSFEYYGATGLPDMTRGFFNTVTEDFHYQLVFRNEGDRFVRMDTEAQRSVHSILPNIARHAFVPLRDAGMANAAFAAGRDEWALFAEGTALTFAQSPMRITNAGSPSHPNRVQVHDWDLFPRPASDWVGNHVGMNIMPLLVYNMSMLDGDPSTLTAEQYNQLRLAWEFLRFFTFDVRAWQSMSQTTFGAHGHTAKEHSFPFVMGQLYWDKMDLHFQAYQREIFGNPNRFPGYHYIMQLWEQGMNWGVWHSIFPMEMAWEGGTRQVSHEWNNRHTVAGVGVGVMAPNWLEQLHVHLPIWDVTFNQRWDTRFDELYDAITRFTSSNPQRVN